MAVEAKNCFGRRSDTIRVTPKAPALGVTAFGIEFRNLRSPRSIPPDRISLLPERNTPVSATPSLISPRLNPSKSSPSCHTTQFIVLSVLLLSAFARSTPEDRLSLFFSEKVCRASQPAQLPCALTTPARTTPHCRLTAFYPSRSQPGSLCSFTTSSLRQSRPEPLQQNWIGCTARTLVSPSSLHNFGSRFHIH